MLEAIDQPSNARMTSSSETPCGIGQRCPGPNANITMDAPGAVIAFTDLP